MEYEVEVKFRLRSTVELLTRLELLGVVLGAAVEQRDAYFNHPSRDFAQTDEAFRIRSVGTENRLTYKGPRVDEQTKTRQEIEIPIEAGDDTRQQMATMLTALGFRHVRTVIKQRQTGHGAWEGRAIEVALDDVLPLGQFVELEMQATATDWPAARDSLLRLAEQLRLTEPERRSYLQLVLEGDPTCINIDM